MEGQDGIVENVAVSGASPASWTGFSGAISTYRNVPAAVGVQSPDDSPGIMACDRSVCELMNWCPMAMGLRAMEISGFERNVGSPRL